MISIILASQSPRRKQLLSILGLKFKVISSDFDESTVEFKISPQEFCESLAYNKAKVVADKNPDKFRSFILFEKMFSVLESPWDPMGSRILVPFQKYLTLV